MTSTKLPFMRKRTYIGMVLLILMGAGSCDYDDSNDIDIIRPNDSTETGLDYHRLKTDGFESRLQTG